MSGTVLALRHVAFEDLGVFEPVLRSRFDAVDHLDVGLDPIGPDVIDADLLVVLGGPIGLADLGRYPDLDEELDAVRRRLDLGRPTLGICLGAQLIAAALGAPVTPAERAEIGYAPVNLTEAGTRSVLRPIEALPVLHWHGDQFEIPDGAQRLASTPDCPNQAFTLDEHVLALQFHLENDPVAIERWLIGHAVELAHHGVDPARIRDGAALHGHDRVARARQVLTAWLDGLG